MTREDKYVCTMHISVNPKYLRKSKSMVFILWTRKINVSNFISKMGLLGSSKAPNLGQQATAKAIGKSNKGRDGVLWR